MKCGEIVNASLKTAHWGEVGKLYGGKSHRPGVFSENVVEHHACGPALALGAGFGLGGGAVGGGAGGFLDAAVGGCLGGAIRQERG